MNPTELAEMLSQMFSVMDMLAEKHGVLKIKTIGDAYMAACGLVDNNSSSNQSRASDRHHAEKIAKWALDCRKVCVGKDRRVFFRFVGW